MVYIAAVAMINALGNSLDEIATNLVIGKTGLTPNNSWLLHGKQTYVGNVKREPPNIPEVYKEHNTRNNRLLFAALSQIISELEYAIKKYGNDRVAIIMGSSTSGIYEGELAISKYEQQGVLPENYSYQQQEMGDSSLFLANYLGTYGPCYTVSTACTSSARAIISGKRLIESGMVDAALVGGADTLCQLSLNGFASLEQISEKLCQPFAKERVGINIGEAAGLMLLTKEPAELALLGVGESSDAWHMSAPHPEGTPAQMAIKIALSEANIQPHQVGYINMHGTATTLNDQMEAKAIHGVFGSDSPPCSSTKHLTGHTLGAAAITEAALAWLIITRSLTLPWQNFTHATVDGSLAKFNLLKEPMQLLKHPIILSNSFAFGGNNTSILLGKVQ